MARIRLSAPLRFNVNGNDREPILLPAGEQEATDVVAAFVAANPEVGEVLPDGPVAEEPAPARLVTRRGRKPKG